MALNKKETGVIAVFSILILGALAYGNGLIPVDNPIAEIVSSEADSESDSTSTTVQALAQRDYDPGQCVDWDQTVTRSNAERSTYVVPCESEHLLEYVSTERYGGFFADYPTSSEMDTIIQEVCKGPARDYLGYDLDPAGRFYVGALVPLEDSWESGDRNFLCSLQANSLTQESADFLVSFTGKVKGARQDLLYPVGTCVAETEDVPTVVSCSEPWEVMITGNTELKGSTRPATDEDWDAAVFDQCAIAGQAHPELFDEELVGWYKIEQSSWDAGSRTVQCILYSNATTL